MSDIVERLRLPIGDSWTPDPTWDLRHQAANEITRLRAEIATLKAENFALAAGVCEVDGGKIGDEHGHFYCALERELATLKASIADEREDAARAMRNECSTVSFGPSGRAVRAINPAQFRSRQP